jgi:nucleotide-binding universal stress UspA family protein
MDEIVVGVDESSGAAEALRWAAAERRLHGCALRAVLCWSYLEQHQAQGDQPFDPAYGDAAARRALDAIVENVLGDEAAAVVRTTVNDLPARGLLEAAAGADLLVLGASGLSGFQRLMLGSVSRQCLHHAAMPIAIVHPRPVQSPRAGVVVGIDGSATSHRALDWALREARRRDVAVTVVHAWAPPYVGSVMAPAVGYDEGELERAGRELVDAAVDAADTTDVTVERRIVCGGAGPALVDAATAASLVVVGSRGRGGFKGLLLGSVSHHVTHHATCPVVVIPHVD